MRSWPLPRAQREARTRQPDIGGAVTTHHGFGRPLEIREGLISADDPAPAAVAGLFVGRGLRIQAKKLIPFQGKLYSNARVAELDARENRLAPFCLGDF